MKNKVSSHILMLLMLIFLTPFTANADTSSAVSMLKRERHMIHIQQALPKRNI